MSTVSPLSREAVQDFQRVYQSEFGKVLSDDESEQMALRVLRVFDLLAQPLPEEEDQSCRAVDG